MSSKRIAFLFSFILLMFLALNFRIYSIINSSNKISASGSINSYSVKVDSKRGNIYDRNMSPLTNEEKIYKICVLPSIESKKVLYNNLSKEKFNSILPYFDNEKPFVFESEKYIEESKGIKTFIVNKRKISPMAMHFVGYCDKSQSKGIYGIESAYNDYLTKDESSLYVNYPVDALNRLLVGTEPEIFNNNYNSKSGIVLTIDSKIQKISENAAQSLKGEGSVLVMDVENGEILAAVSKPSFDINNIPYAINSNDKPLLNRNLCSYNIGSTFKIVVAAAALSKGISPNFTVNCTGKLNIGGTDFYCHKDKGHGYMNMEYAFANSCNPYFIRLSSKIGKERLIALSNAYGLNESIKLCEGISTSKGTVPLANEIKNSGDLANIGFGQGKLMATPIHIARIISSIANGGKLVSPSLVIGKSDKNGKIEKESSKSNVRILKISVADKIKKYMITTVERGTGRIAKPMHLSAGGKTASAETGLYKDGENIVRAWFSGFYPASAPKYAIVVLCENGKSGAKSCGPVFKKICDELYKNGYCK